MQWRVSGPNYCPLYRCSRTIFWQSHTHTGYLFCVNSCCLLTLLMDQRVDAPCLYAIKEYLHVLPLRCFPNKTKASTGWLLIGKHDQRLLCSHSNAQPKTKQATSQLVLSIISDRNTRLKGTPIYVRCWHFSQARTRLFAALWIWCTVKKQRVCFTSKSNMKPL